MSCYPKVELPLLTHGETRQLLSYCKVSKINNWTVIIWFNIMKNIQGWGWVWKHHETFMLFIYVKTTWHISLHNMHFNFCNLRYHYNSNTSQLTYWYWLVSKTQIGHRRYQHFCTQTWNCVKRVWSLLFLFPKTKTHGSKSFPAGISKSFNQGSLKETNSAS